MLLVDTCVWIDFMRGRKSSLIDLLESHIEAGEVCINGVIFNEICLGARDSAQFKKFKAYFGEIPLYPLLDWHEKIADMRFFLKTKGITTFLPDAIIAQTALANHLTLATSDQDFKPYAKFLGLKITVK